MRLSKQTRYISVALTLTCAAILSAADARESEVRKAQQSFCHCWETRDSACMDRLLTADFDFITRTGRKEDRAAFLAMIKGGNISPTFDVPNDAAIRFYGPVALLTFPVDVSNIPGRGPTAPTAVYITMVWSRATGPDWHLAHGMVAVYRPGSPPPQAK